MAFLKPSNHSQISVGPYKDPRDSGEITSIMTEKTFILYQLDQLPQTCILSNQFLLPILPVMFNKSLKLHKHGGSIMVTIPADLANHLGLAKGDRVDACYDDKRFVIDFDGGQRAVDKTASGPCPAHVEAMA
jgi:hypothetical protein